MKIEVRATTCTARLVDGTAVAFERRLAAAGLDEHLGAYVRHVDGEGDSPEERMVDNWHGVLRDFLAGESDVVVVLEDDVLFAEQFGRLAREWLEWLITYDPGMWIGSFYNPGNPSSGVAFSRAPSMQQRTVKVDSNHVYGSQAFSFNRPAARYVFDHWLEAPGLQDIKAATLVGRGGGSFYYHRPSIVEHAPGVPSTRTGTPASHRSKDFSAKFGTDPRGRFKK